MKLTHFWALVGFLVAACDVALGFLLAALFIYLVR